MTGLRSQVEGAQVWSDGSGRVEVRFVGRGPQPSRRRMLDLVAPEENLRLARLQQIHSARVADAHDGSCGRADALVTGESSLALSVVTADCVPVLVATHRAIAAVHAGWRGIAAGVVGNAVDALLGEPTPARGASPTAWIGPSIGPCCYEVSEEVAAEVAAASSHSVIAPRPGCRPHLDLTAAVAGQLKRLGIAEIRSIDVCTRCHPRWLWSYRRDGAGAGRNLAFIWRRPDPA